LKPMHTFDSMFLHSCNFFKSKTQGIYHETYFRSIELIVLVEFKSGEEQDKQDKKADGRNSVRKQLINLTPYFK
jgi:hypothetical protein